MNTIALERYEELAKKLVALGVGERIFVLTENNHPSYIIFKEYLSAEQFVTDARVMAAVMEIVRNTGCEAWHKLMRNLMYEFGANNMNLSITATCVELLEELE